MENRVFCLGMLITALAVDAALIGCATDVSNAQPVTINIDLNKTYQTIEGFGFFGGRDVWWGTRDESRLYSDEWAEKIIVDLGLTMWRNEVYPNNPVRTSQSTEPQDADWDKQKRVVEGLYRSAKDHGVDLKIILTVWTPPGEWKTNNSTKNGGSLKPEHYTDYANWLVSALDMYKEIGVDVYGLSLQNEPNFEEFYNSCVYTPAEYIALIKTVVPVIKAKYPDVLIFGSEHLLSWEFETWAYPHARYDSAIKKDEAAFELLDAVATHSYSDGVLAGDVGKHRVYWAGYFDMFGPSGKKLWMTETSGYTDNWIGVKDQPGALDYGLAIISALKYGKVSAWCWFYGSENDNPQLMNGKDLSTGKRYAVSKQFYQFIRPGAVMVEADCADRDLVVATFNHEAEDRFTCVIVNTSGKDKIISLNGVNMAKTFDKYETSADKNVNCTLSQQAGNEGIVVKPYSIVTLER